MIDILLKSLMAWFAAIIAIEAITEIVINGKIFTRIRSFLAKRNKFIRDLLACGYCFSVWVSVIAILLPGKPIGWFVDHPAIPVIDAVIRVFVAHRLSNVLHEGINRWLNQIPLFLQHPIGETDTDISVTLDDDNGT